MTRWRLIRASLLQRKLRTLVTVAGVAIGCAALYCMLAFEKGYQRGIQEELNGLGAHILVAPKGCPYDAASMALHGASWPCYLKEDYLQRIRSTGGVAEVAPMLMNAVFTADTGAQNVYVGADTSLMKLKHGWHIDGAFPVGLGDCMLGSTVAKALHARVGAVITLPGITETASTARSATVSGILNETGQSDDTFIFISIPAAQRLFNRPHQLTHMLVRLQDPNLLQRVVNDLRGCDAGMDMNVVPVAHVFSTIQNIVNTTRVLLACIAIAGLAVAATGVGNAVMMSVTERTREIGIMRAAGASRTDVFGLVFSEAAVLCALGGISGLCTALLASRAVEAWVKAQLPFAPNGAIIRPEPLLMCMCLLAALCTGLAAGILPAWRASTMSPICAMRDREAMQTSA
jgi:putative ABC transport system permease protein